jgi:hypothetical protein
MFILYLNSFYLNRNDLRKALNENDESPVTPSSIDTTKSYAPTTTSTSPSTTSTTEYTTKSTTTTISTTQRSTTTALVTTKRYPLWKNSDDVPKTPKTYFSNSFYQNNNNKNQNNINGPTYDTKSPFKIVTKRPSSDNVNDSDISSATKPATPPTINPFYYGFNRLPRYSTTSRYNTQQYNTKLSTTTITTQSPPSTIKSSTPYQFHHYFFTSTKKPDLLAYSTTYATNYEVDNNYHENNHENIVETEKPKSSTYNPVFDIYFKQIARQRTAVPHIG